MITAEQFKSKTAKELAATAKRKGIAGWHAMRKEELVKALLKLARSEAAKASRKDRAHKKASNGKASNAKASNAKASNGKASNGKASNGKASNGKASNAKASNAKASNRKASNGKARAKEVEATVARKSQPAANNAKRKKSKEIRAEKPVTPPNAMANQSKDLAYVAGPNGNGHTRDRLVLMVRDPFWLHAYWELTRQSIERARVALGRHWHSARPILRLSKVSREASTSTARTVLRDIDIHGGVNNWYIDVQDPPHSFQIDIGYLAPDVKFLSLARSNVVTTPQTDTVDGNWEEVAQDFDRIYALSGGYEDRGDSEDLKNLFEQRLRRPMGSPMVTRYGLGAGAANGGRSDFCFDVDAELIVHGVVNADSHVTLKGEPVRLQPDGSFTVRFGLPNRRQVLPVVACSSDGVEQRTIILAIERNTKRMEPVIREPGA